MSVLPPDRVWRRRKESGLTEERERLRETHKYRLYTAACNWAQKQKPKESSVLTTNTGKLPSEETFYVNALQGHSTPKNYWTIIITAMGFDRKTIRFGALHNEIKSNLRRDLRFSAYVISGGFINSCRERYRHHGLEKAKGFPCGRKTTAGGLSGRPSHQKQLWLTTDSKGGRMQGGGAPRSGWDETAAKTKHSSSQISFSG